MNDNEGTQGTKPQVEKTGFVRALGLVPATAINMTQMVGIGPFITIPVILTAMGGPQAMLGWYSEPCLLWQMGRSGQS
jgi:hypothetical protein